MGRVITKEKLFTITKKDFIFKYYKGSGSGGQKKNKTENCCQITHIKSNTQASSEDGRSKEYNKQNAFNKLTKKKSFINWIKLEAARKSGQLDIIKNKVESEIKNNITIEIKENGCWKNDKL